jgi:transposase-like protein
LAKGVSRIFLRRKAISTIIGATFFIVILMASLGVVAWQIMRYDSYMQIVRSSESWERERQNEKIQIIEISVSSGKPSMTVANRGGITAHLVSLWITEYRNGASTWRRSFDLTGHRYFLNPGTSAKNVGSDLDVNMQSSNQYGYFIAIVTGRGNVATQYYSGPELEPPKLTYVDGSMDVGGYRVASFFGIPIWQSWFTWQKSFIAWSTLKQGYTTPMPDISLPIGKKTVWMRATFRNNSTFGLTVRGDILLTICIMSYTNDNAQEVQVDDVVFMAGRIAQRGIFGISFGFYSYSTPTIPGGGQSNLEFILDQYDSIFNAPYLSTGPKGKGAVPWVMLTSIALSSSATYDFRVSGTYMVDGLLITSG